MIFYSFYVYKFVKKYIYTNKLKIIYGSFEWNLWRLFWKTGTELDKTNHIFGIIGAFSSNIGVEQWFRVSTGNASYAADLMLVTKF